MLGRVMGCMEQVFIHDGLGQPIYFETHSGHGPTGEHVLGLFEKIEDVIVDVPRSRARVFRAIVMDGANNSVKCLRAFAAQDTFHYITTLDDNQWDDRRTRSRSYPTRYRYGDATLRDLDIELEDSQEKGYLIVTRAIKIEWDNGRQTVLITSIPRRTVDASEIVFSYFRRWPAQELTYRYEKATVSLSRVAGYGRKKVANLRQQEKRQKLAQKISTLNVQLKDALDEINAHEQAITTLIPKERRLRAKTKLANGKRIVPQAIRADFERCGKAIRSHQRAIKAIEKAHEKEFKAFTKSQREWLCLQGKETDYAVDVELDQILTYFRAKLSPSLCLLHPTLPRWRADQFSCSSSPRYAYTYYDRRNRRSQEDHTAGESEGSEHDGKAAGCNRQAKREENTGSTKKANGVQLELTANKITLFYKYPKVMYY